MSSINRQVRLAARPSGLPQASDWDLCTGTVPAPGPGQFVVALSHLSVDPAMRGWMNAGVSYVPPVEIGAVMRAGGIGRVTVTEHQGFADGDYVYGAFGVQEYAVSDGRGVLKLDTSLAPPTTYLGALGMTGLTAYFALLAPAAMGCLAVAILRTRVLPRWTGYVFLAAAALLLGQYAAFRGALPFPQFLAFLAIGIAALAHRTPTASPSRRTGEIGVFDI